MSGLIELLGGQFMVNRGATAEAYSRIAIPGPQECACRYLTDEEANAIAKQHLVENPLPHTDYSGVLPLGMNSETAGILTTPSSPCDRFPNTSGSSLAALLGSSS